MTPITPSHTFSFADTMHSIYHANAGEGLPRHEHTYAHATICHAGSIVVRKEGKEVVFTKATQPAVLVAVEWHEIEALEDGTVFENVFAVQPS